MSADISKKEVKESNSKSDLQKPKSPSADRSTGVSAVILYCEGTIIKSSGLGEVRIYVKKKYWELLQKYLGKEVRVILVIE